MSVLTRSCLVVCVCAVAALPAAAQKVYIDYDMNYEFDNVRTFAWQTTEETSLAKENPLMHSRIVNGIEHYISMSGVREVNEDPDIWITYHTSSREEVSINTTNWGYGYPGGWGYGGYYGAYPGYVGGSSTTSVSTYERGTLVVDVWDAKTKELVWRGMATNITVVDNPSKMEKKIDKALKKIVSASRKSREKEAKKKG